MTAQKQACCICKQEVRVGYPDGGLMVHGNPADGLICIQSGLPADTNPGQFVALMAENAAVSERHRDLMAARVVQRDMRPRRPDDPWAGRDFDRTRMIP